MNNNNQDDIEMLHNLDYLNKANYINLNNNQNDKKINQQLLLILQKQLN